MGGYPITMVGFPGENELSLRSLYPSSLDLYLFISFPSQYNNKRDGVFGKDRKRGRGEAGNFLSDKVQLIYQ